MHSNRQLTQRGQQQMESLLRSKNLDAAMFYSKDLTPYDDLNTIANWLDRNIYSVRYKKSRDFLDFLISANTSISPIAPIREELNLIKFTRLYHGMPHVSKAAYLIPVFANLYCQFDPSKRDIVNQTPRFLFYTQIASLLHDSGREDDGVDYWDKDSGLICYFFLTCKFGLSHQEAIPYAEAIANKDWKDYKNYYALKMRGGKLIWSKINKQKSFIATLIQCVDCAEMLRFNVENFKSKLLDFYNDIANYNYAAKVALNILLREIYTINNCDEVPETNVYQTLKNTIANNINLLYLFLYYNENQLLSHDTLRQNFFAQNQFNPKAGLNAENIFYGMLQGAIALRGVGAGSALSNKMRNGQHETLAACEIRKTLRQPDKNISNYKRDKNAKKGNPCRSVCIPLIGRTAYADAGFIVFLNDTTIRSISNNNFGSGYLKKKNFQKHSLTPYAVKHALKKLNDSFKIFYPSHQSTNTSYHNEIISDIDKYQAIYYSRSNYHPFNFHLNNQDSSDPVALLQAIFLQHEYKRLTNILLPIYEVTPHLQTMTLYSKDSSTLWLTALKNYYANKKPLNDENVDLFRKTFFPSLNDDKTQALYATNQTTLFYIEKLKAPENLPTVLQDKLNLELMTFKILYNTSQSCYHRYDLSYSILSYNQFLFYLRTQPSQCDAVLIHLIKKQIQKLIDTRKIFDSIDLAYDFADGNLIAEHLQAKLASLDPCRVGVDDYYLFLKAIGVYTIAQRFGFESQVEEIRAQALEVIRRTLSICQRDNIANLQLPLFRNRNTLYQTDQLRMVFNKLLLLSVMYDTFTPTNDDKHNNYLNLLYNQLLDFFDYFILYFAMNSLSRAEHESLKQLVFLLQSCHFNEEHLIKYFMLININEMGIKLSKGNGELSDLMYYLESYAANFHYQNSALVFTTQWLLKKLFRKENIKCQDFRIFQVDSLLTCLKESHAKEIIIHLLGHAILDPNERKRILSRLNEILKYRKDSFALTYKRFIKDFEFENNLNASITTPAILFFNIPADVKKDFPAKVYVRNEFAFFKGKVEFDPATKEIEFINFNLTKNSWKTYCKLC